MEQVTVLENSNLAIYRCNSKINDLRSKCNNNKSNSSMILFNGNKYKVKMNNDELYFLHPNGRCWDRITIL